jgi:hypothetical protein
MASGQSAQRWSDDVSEESPPRTGRASAALRALDEDVELARRRVWHRIEDGIELERRRRRRRARWLGGSIAAAVAAVAVLVPVAMNAGGGSGSSAPEQHQVSLGSVADMLGSRPPTDADTSDPEQFFRDFVTEASTGAE